MGSAHSSALALNSQSRLLPLGGQSFDALPGDAGGEVEDPVARQHGEPGPFGRAGDDEAGSRGGPLPAVVSQQGQDFHCPVLDAGARYSTGIADTGGRRSRARRSAE